MATLVSNTERDLTATDPLETTFTGKEAHSLSPLGWFHQDRVLHESFLLKAFAVKM